MKWVSFDFRLMKFCTFVEYKKIKPVKKQISITLIIFFLFFSRLLFSQHLTNEGSSITIIDVGFPVGTSTSYLPATLNNSGTPDNYGINVGAVAEETRLCKLRRGRPGLAAKRKNYEFQP